MKQLGDLLMVENRESTLKTPENFDGTVSLNENELEEIQKRSLIVNNGSSDENPAIVRDTVNEQSSESLHEYSEYCKQQGNEAFSKNAFETAASFYTKAIDSYTQMKNIIEPSPLHIYYTNRALCHLKLENYGFAIMDASKAIEICPNFSKAYYRRGCAYAALGKFSLALNNFVKASSLKNDPDTRIRIKECQKEVRQLKFAKAISLDRTKPVSATVDLSKLEATIDSSYTGIRYRRDPEFLNELLEYMETPDHLLVISDMYRMVLDMNELLKKLSNVVKINLEPEEEFTICGDIHGQFYDLLNIFKINGLPSKSNPYLFNGDFVDRGSFSVECITVLFAAKLTYPDYVHLARGNHETKQMNELYGFKGEVEAKYDKVLYELFCECFCRLPLAHLINERVFIVHGGLFARDGVTLSDIEQVNRNVEPADEGIMTEMLWSDPQTYNGRSPSKRGIACSFGPDITKAFLENNNLDYVIRSHEMKEEGYDIQHDGKLITVFSAPNYCDSMGNKGAFIRLKAPELIPSFSKFYAVSHPPVRPMRYAKPFFSIMA